MIGLAVAAIGLSYGANAGYAINPARDFWIPIVGPLVGGVIGVVVYDLFVGDVLHIRARLLKPPEVGCTRPITTTDEKPG